MDLYLRKIFIVFLVLRLCTSQSTSTAFCNTCSAAPTCTGCNVNADVLTMSNTSWGYLDPATGTPYLEANIHFTAYSVTSTVSEAGKCITHTSSPVPRIDAYIVSVPFIASYASWQSPVSAQYTSFLDVAYSSFYEEVGYEGCTPTLPPSQSYPTWNLRAIVSATALPSATPAEASANPTEDSVPVRHVRSTQIIIVSVVVPTVGLMLPLICFILIRRYRKKRSQAASTNHSVMTSNVQLYVDQKAELEDEERRKQELEAGVIRYEMEGEDRRFEMPGDENTCIGLASSNKTHELGGAEHSKELEVPGNT